MVELNCTVPVVLDCTSPPEDAPPPSTCVLFTQSSHSLIVMRGPSFVGDRHSASAERQVSASPPVTASSCVSVRRTPLPAGALSVACSTGLSAGPKAGGAGPPGD